MNSYHNRQWIIPKDDPLFSNGRMMWIDWMKAIGIYLIVYGHLFSVGHWYVYTFSVPLFFLISGFLCKREENLSLFWKKIWYNLVLPLLLISFINYAIGSIFAIIKGNYDVGGLWKFLIDLLLGFHSSVGSLWFVYTLILLKIIHQHLPINKGRF